MQRLLPAFLILGMLASCGPSGGDASQGAGSPATTAFAAEPRLQLAAQGASKPPPDSCIAEIGQAAADRLAEQCKVASPATHPPCHPLNSCALIRDEIARGCGQMPAGQRPGFCSAGATGGQGTASTGGSGGQAAACSSAALSKVDAFVREHDALTGLGTSSSKSTRCVELNGKAPAEALVVLQGQDNCGARGCTGFALDLSGAKARSVGDFTAATLEPLATSTNGWRDLTLNGITIRFEGGKYRSAK